MVTAAHIITELGGSAAVARETGFPLSTINSWKDANFIPEWRQPRLVMMARKLGKPITGSDFPPVEQRTPRRVSGEAQAA